ncbi:C2H2 type master regulator of conidiophore development brlA [Hyphodiscus hymeniophilus]|uniref:C2H2 type master regulator of conidiophore development brlA n=1 Tax=Hyphodiscus hymeniophilus TaxID=353542 RepID=A0A9P6VJT6_9HELO|nr:C2H2 type master regulator of conidiophore development brlA [Hyphodiscus hymeniophilus]
MAMFEDPERQYTGSYQSSCPSLSGTSNNGSLYSWDIACTTPPPSIRQNTLDSMKLEDMSFCTDNSPEAYISSSMSSMPLMAYDTVPIFHETSMSGPRGKMLHDHPLMVGNNNFSFTNDDFGSFHANHGLQAHSPTMETDLSSPMSMNFVNPSQTTFHNTLESHSPMPQLHFSSPSSDYTHTLSMDHSPMNNMNIYMQYEDCKSATTTNSRASSTRASRVPSPRKPVSGLAWTSAELQKIQFEQHAGRNKEKRTRRDVNRAAKRASDAPIQASSKNACPFPGCSGKFKRPEHLKRHNRLHYPEDYPPEQCPFCPKKIAGGRGDNLATHVGLHDDLKKKRTDYDPRARPWLDQREKEKGKKKANTKANKQSRDGPGADVELSAGSRALGY